MAWGQVAAAGISSAAQFGSQLFGSAKSYKQNAALMGLEALLSYYYQRQLNRNAYQDTTYSMRQAGINPMLAIGNGASAGSVSVGLNSANGPSGVDLDLANVIATAKQLKNDTQRVNNETRNTDASIKKMQYEADLAHEQSAKLNQETRLLDSYGDQKEQLEIQNLVKQGQLIDAQKADYTNQIINRDRSVSSAISLNRYQEGYYSSNSASAKQTAIQQQRDNEWFKNHPGWYNFAQGASAIGNVFRGGLSVGAGIKK